MSAAGPDSQALIAEARRHLSEQKLDQARVEFEQALSMDPGEATVYNDYGRVLNNLRDYDAARQAFASAVALDPAYAEAHNNLGHVLRAMNQASAAAESFRRAVSIRPDYATAWRNLGTVLALTGDYEEAIAAQEQALALAPGDVDTHLNLAGLYRVTDGFAGARRHLACALELAPGLADAWSQMGSLLESEGALESAAEHYRAALKRDAAHVEALAGLADLLDKSGCYEEGLALLEPALATMPDEPRLCVARARLLRRVGETEKALALLAATRSARPAECERLPRYFFSLGDLYDDMAQYEAAFGAYEAANRLKDEHFDPQDIIDAVDALIGVFTRRFLGHASGSGCTSERPVFIVGMPRSGTSLVEQMLASHPQVHGAGELRLIVDMVRELGRDDSVPGRYPECVPSLASTRLADLARHYLDALTAMNQGAPRVTDKMPHNFLHLGLIQLLFPRARIIHCTRHPVDTALSCYFQDFASTAMSFSNDLEHLGIYYLQYRRLMQHWESVLDLPMTGIRYEALVDDTESHVRDLLTFLGLEWDEQVMRFHESRRRVNTASHAQVRQPIYRRSLARHMNYAPYVSGLIGTLRPLAADAEL